MEKSQNPLEDEPKGNTGDLTYGFDIFGLIAKAWILK